MNSLSKAFDVFLSTNELGATDSKKLNSILNKLDENNQVSKNKIISIIASNSKDQEGAYRNYISRLKHAINSAKEIESKDSHILQTINLDILKTDSEQFLKLSGFIPKTLNTVIPNNNYNKNNYIESFGSDGKLSIFISYATNDEKEVIEFKEIFEKLQPETTINWTMREIIIGIDFDYIIKKELNSCDYGFAMISEDFLKSEYIKNIELKKLLEENKIIPILLNGELKELKDKYQKEEQVKELFDKHIFYLWDRKRIDSFSTMVTSDSKETFVKGFLTQFDKRKIYDESSNNTFSENHLCYINGHEAYDQNKYIYSKGDMQTIDFSLEKNITNKKLSKETNILDDMFNWLKEPEKPIYALLGDYGVGKTFNTRMFALKAEEKRKTDKSIPYCLYIDLRDIPTYIDNKQPTINQMIDEILRLSNNNDFSASKIISDNKKGKSIIIFDGLDEKLVHYTKDMKSKFLRELLYVINETTLAKYNQKIVISCRTHYFESIQEQNSFFRDYSRNDIGKSKYKAILILPFNMKQITKYLENAFKSDKSTLNNILNFLDSDTYLKSIISKPLMLNKITSILPILLEKKEKNENINSKIFYKSLIEDTFYRDNEKHIISIRDKKRLLKEVSYLFYEKSIQTIEIDRLYDWFNEYIYDQTIFKKYWEEDINTLEQDLRNSSLLVRFGESKFGFSHSSFYEYFLSEYIIDNWEKFEFSQKLSSVTQQFIIEEIESLDIDKKNIFIEKVKITLGKEIEKNKNLALFIADKLSIKLDTIVIKSQKLENYNFKNIICNKFSIINTNLHNSSFINCKISTLELINSNLSESFINESKILNIIKDNNSLMENITDTTNCIDKKKLNILNYHNFNKNINIKYKRHETFHEDSIKTISIDDKYIYSVSTDKTIKIWDKNSYCCITTINAHDEIILTLTHDDNYFYSGSKDKSIKVWDKKNFSCIKIITGHEDSILVLENDKTYLYSGSHDKTIKIWDKKDFKCINTITNEDYVKSLFLDNKYIYNSIGDSSFKVRDKNTLKVIKTIKHQEGTLLSVTTDNQYIYTSFYGNIIKVWDKQTLNCIKTIEAHTNPIWSIINDKTHFYSSSGDGTIKVWDKETMNCIKTINAHKDPIWKLTYDKKYIYSCSDDRTIKVWDKKTMNCIKTIKGNNPLINIIGQCTNKIYFGNFDKSLVVIDKKNLKIGNNKVPLWELNKKVTFKQRDINNVFNVSTYNNKKVKFKQINSNNNLNISTYNNKKITTYYKDSKYNYLSVNDENIYITNKDGTKCIKKLKGKSSNIQTFILDENYIYSISKDSILTIWEKKTFECIKTLQLKYSNVLDLLEDENYIYIFSSDNSIQFIDKISLDIKIKYFIFRYFEWCSIDFDTNKIQGTIGAREYISIIDKNDHAHFINDLENFELKKYLT